MRGRKLPGSRGRPKELGSSGGCSSGFNGLPVGGCADLAKLVSRLFADAHADAPAINPYGEELAASRSHGDFHLAAGIGVNQ